MKNPLVSIIIPTYNRCALLGETLESVIAQTYSYWECIVVDDGSTDDTRELMDLYCEKDKRIKYITRLAETGKGPGSCRNLGFQQSSGEYVMWLDDDDLLHRKKIEKQVYRGIKYPNSVITCSWGRFSNSYNYNEKKLPIYRNYKESIKLIEDYGKFDCFFPCHVFLLSRSVINKAGLWKTDLSINDDGEFFCRVILAADCIQFSAETNVKYRSHNLNKVSSLNSLEKAKDIVRSWKYIEKNLSLEKINLTKQYVRNGKKHAYYLLKMGGYKSIIIRNVWFFKSFIYKDLLKKMIFCL